MRQEDDFYYGRGLPGKGSLRKECVRRQLEEGKDPLEEVQALLAEKDGETLVVTADEVGCGIVPTDAFERAYREAAGRVNCLLAERADQVIRMVCGIGVRIK